MSATDELVASGFHGRELVTCADGPRAGAWYFLDWWKEQRRLAEWGHETPLIGSTLGYIPGRRKTPHPKNIGIEGHVLLWDPATAAAALKAGTNL